MLNQTITINVGALVNYYICGIFLSLSLSLSLSQIIYCFFFPFSFFPPLESPLDHLPADEFCNSPKIYLKLELPSIVKIVSNFTFEYACTEAAIMDNV
jgi:hypothetical protein